MGVDIGEPGAYSGLMLTWDLIVLQGLVAGSRVLEWNFHMLVEVEVEVASMVSPYSPRMDVAPFVEELAVHESTGKDEILVVAVQVGLLEQAGVGVGVEVA